VAFSRHPLPEQAQNEQQSGRRYRHAQPDQRERGQLTHANGVEEE
jgi:hypothetical protein